MTARMLPGVQRIGPDEWRWGCWLISAVDMGNDRPYWMAVDTVSELTNSQHWARVKSDFSPRELLFELNAAGPGALDPSGVSALQARLDQLDAMMRERAVR